MEQFPTREDHPRFKELQEKFKFRVTLMDYETGEVLDSTSINMPYFGAGYLVPPGPISRIMEDNAASLARTLVHSWLARGRR